MCPLEDIAAELAIFLPKNAIDHIPRARIGTGEYNNREERASLHEAVWVSGPALNVGAPRKVSKAGKIVPLAATV